MIYRSFFPFNVLSTSPILNMCIVSILTHFFFGCLLILYDDFFWIVVLNFNIVQFRNTFLYAVFLCPVLRHLCALYRSGMCSPISFSKGCTVLVSIIRSAIHLELILHIVWGRVKSHVFFLMESSFPSTSFDGINSLKTSSGNSNGQPSFALTPA